MFLSRLASFLPAAPALSVRSLATAPLLDDSDVAVTHKGGVFTFTLKRPSLNKISPKMLEILKKKLLNLNDAMWLSSLGLNSRDPVRALIITGYGDKAFSAGADLSAIRELDQQSVRNVLHQVRSINNILEKASFPTIAALNGITFGLGLELALACRVRYASENALLALPEIRVGLIPGGGGTQRLPRLIGEGRAQEMIMTGNPMCAVRAYETGLVNRVFSSETLIPEVEAIAEQITKNTAEALCSANMAIAAGRKGEEVGYYREGEEFVYLSDSVESRRAVSAFLNRNKTS
jgi:enoyl-CoA hydratase